jgi:xylulokinase
MFLGIDVGTGGTRAVLINRDGGVIASASSEHAAIHSQHIGWAEQDPEDWWRAARQAITAVMAAAELAGAEIQSIGLTGQMHGCVMLDARGEVLRPALIWCDQRTQPECRPGAPDRAHLQPGAAQLHPHQAALGAHPPA